MLLSDHKFGLLLSRNLLLGFFLYPLNLANTNIMFNSHPQLRHQVRHGKISAYKFRQLASICLIKPCVVDRMIESNPGFYGNQRRQTKFPMDKTESVFYLVFPDIQPSIAFLGFRDVTFCLYCKSSMQMKMRVKHRQNDIKSGKRKYSEKNISQCHFALHKPHTDLAGIEIGSSG